MTVEVGSASYSFDVSFERGVSNLNKIDGAINSTNKNLKTFDTQATATAKGVNRAFTQNIQNASFQVQDFAVQVASGQSAMVAFTQQLPQLIGGLGLLGAGIATAVAVFGGLYLVLGDTATNADKLGKAVENVQAVITVGAGGVKNYTDEMKRLSQISETLARIKLAQSIAESEEVISRSTQEIKTSFDEFIGGSRQGLLFFRREVELFAEQVGGDMSKVAEAVEGRGLLTRQSQFAETLRRLQNDFDITAQQALELGLAYSDLATKGDAISAQKLNTVLESIAQSAGFGNEKINEITSSLAKYFVQIVSSVDATNQMRQALGSNTKEIIGSTGASNEAIKSFERLTQSLTTQEIALSLGERAAFAYTLALQNLTPEQYNSALASYDRIRALEGEKRAQEELNKELDNYFAAEERRSAQESGRANQFAERIIQRGASESELFAAEQQKLFELREQGLISQQKYDQAVVASVQNRNAQIERANAQQLQSQALFTQQQGQLLGSLNNLFGAFASTTDARDKKSFEKKKKFQTAQALINTAMAVSNALAAAPPPVNFALAGLAGAAGAVQVAAIRNQQFSGGREFGGGVTQGSAYRVGEGNMPELYRSSNGQLGMIPGDNGRVIPMDKMGGGQTKVEIHNYTGAPVKQTQSDDGRMTKIVIGEVARQIATGNGPIPKAMRANTSTQFQNNR